MQNVYYVIPTINVDGLAYIEDVYKKTGIFEKKRKNMHIVSKACGPTQAGVDLNRNYGTMFGFGDNSSYECGGKNDQIYKGESAFSEPET